MEVKANVGGEKQNRTHIKILNEFPVLSNIIFRSHKIIRLHTELNKINNQDLK